MKQPLTYEVEYWFLNMHPIKKSAPKGSKGFKIVNYDR